MERLRARRAAGDPLLVPLARLLTDPPGSSRALELEETTLDLGDQLRQASPATGRLKVARTNRGVLVTGTIRTSLAESCSRCLRPVALPLEASLEEEVLPSVDVASGLPVAAAPEDDEVPRLTDHHELDLELLLREAIQLAEPIAPLCRPDCPGLCVVCGGELASGGHAHADAPIDPRLEALRAFRRDEADETG